MSIKQVQIQSILFPNPDICSEEDLYYHHKSADRIDFNGYFNLFYIEKRKKYTNLENVSLSLELQGFTKLILVYNGSDIKTFTLNADILQKYCFTLPYAQYQTGVFWFAVIREPSCNQASLSGFYMGELEENNIRNIHLCIDICTYRRELYIGRNLSKIKQSILSRTELDVSSHLSIYIIDNGQTLCENEYIQSLVQSCSSQIHVIPNKNTGGAGGFTRGMIEILDKKKEYGYTHVLLMDDDAVIEPDCIVRIYGLLCTLKEEWKDMIVGGAMLREDSPHLLYCCGEWWNNGRISNPLLHLDLRKLEHASCNDLLKTGHEFDRYSGWWCCCYSLNTVRSDNLPIPLFLHHDDIEFGLRNKKRGIVFLNGICIWHKGPDAAFPGGNLYYDVRNNLIEVALHQPKSKQSTARKIYLKAMVSAIFRLKYQDVDLVQRAVKDFLSGPEWLVMQNASNLHNEIHQMSLTLQPLEQLYEEFPPSIKEVVQQKVSQVPHDISSAILANAEKKQKEPFLKYILTFNGWLSPTKGREPELILPSDSPFKAYRKQRLLLYEPGTNKGLLISRDYKKLLDFFQKLIPTWFLLEKNFHSVALQYQHKAKWLASKNTWEQYYNHQ